MPSLRGAGVLAGVGQGLNRGVSNFFKMQNMIKDREARSKRQDLEDKRYEHKQSQADQLHAMKLGNLKAMGNIGADSLRPGAGSTVDGPGIDPAAAEQERGVTTAVPGAENLAQTQGRTGYEDLEGDGPAMSLEEIEKMAYQANLNIRERKRILKTMRDLAPKAEAMIKRMRKIQADADRLRPMIEEFKQFPADPSKWKSLSKKYGGIKDEDRLRKHGEAIQKYQKLIQEHAQLQTEFDPMVAMVKKYGVPAQALKSQAALTEWLNQQEGQLNALGANYR